MRQLHTHRAMHYAGRQIIDGAWTDVRSLLHGSRSLLGLAVQAQGIAAAILGTLLLLQPPFFIQNQPHWRCVKMIR